MALFVYALCATTALVCFGLLLRQHRREHSTLALMSSLSFLCFAAANVLMFFDLIVFKQLNLRLWRDLVTLTGVLVLLFALTSDPGRRKLD